MGSSKTIRLGLWGLGTHARRNIIPAIGRSSRVDLVALHSRNAQLLSETSASVGVRSHLDTAAFLDDAEVDAVYIATPTGLHAEMALAAIDAGKHVWCEKPMTATYEETVAVVAEARGAGVVALETDMFLHHPQHRELRRLVALPDIGPIASMTARFGFPHRDGNDFRYSPQLGGGALLDAGFYPIAAAVDLLGPGLQLAGCTLAHAAEWGIDIGGSAIAVASHRAAMLDWGFGRSYRSEIEVWCEGAVIQLSRAFAKPASLETEVHVRYQSGEIETVAVAAADQFALMLDEFANITLGRRAFDPEPQTVRARLLAEIRDTAI